MDDDLLPIDEALQVLRAADVRDGITFGLVEATWSIMVQCENPLVMCDDLLRCLDYGGLIAEFGARGLYVCTNRDGIGWSTPDDLWILAFDRPNWEQYLRANKLWPST